MTFFTYKNPILRGSTKEIEIFDSNQEKMGSIQRYYRNKLQRACDFIFNSQFIINVIAFDLSNEIACEINEILGKSTLLKSQWNGSSTNIGDFKLFDQTKIKTHPRWKLQTEEEIYTIEKNLGNKKVFIEDDYGKRIAEITYEKPIPPQNITIKTYSEKLNYLEIASLYLLINIQY